MDLLKLIREQCKSFTAADSYPAIEAVVGHIEVAEKHFELAKREGDYLYTDVIYRTNQAFEGALREAMRILTGQDPAKLSLYKIEQYFENHKILNERVLAQFTNYRTEWRNKATHDYQLFFSAQEALLAIVSISAFFSILLDQMIEKYAHEQEREKLGREPFPLLENVRNYNQLDFLHQCVELLKHFAKSFSRELENSTKIPSEYEIIGMLSGFISLTDPAVKISTEKSVSVGAARMILDLLLEKDDSHVLVEVKGPTRRWNSSAQYGVEQVKSYLAATNLSDGILFVPPSNASSELGVQNKTFLLNDRAVRIAVISPPSKF